MAPSVLFQNFFVSGPNLGRGFCDIFRMIIIYPGLRGFLRSIVEPITGTQNHNASSETRSCSRNAETKKAERNIHWKSGQILVPSRSTPATMEAHSPSCLAFTQMNGSGHNERTGLESANSDNKDILKAYWVSSPSLASRSLRMYASLTIKRRHILSTKETNT